MASASQLIIYFIIILVVTTLVLYLLIGTLNGRTAFISSRLGVAKDALLSVANSAIVEAQSIVGQAFDFANIIVSDINRVLQAVAQSIAQIVSTLGQSLVDLIGFIVAVVDAQNQALLSQILGFFDAILVPIFDTINQGLMTIIAVGTALFKTFDPTSC